MTRSYQRKFEKWPLRNAAGTITTVQVYVRGTGGDVTFHADCDDPPFSESDRDLRMLHERVIALVLQRSTEIWEYFLAIDVTADTSGYMHTNFPNIDQLADLPLNKYHELSHYAELALHIELWKRTKRAGKEVWREVTERNYGTDKTKPKLVCNLVPLTQINLWALQILLEQFKQLGQNLKSWASSRKLPKDLAQMTVGVPLQLTVEPSKPKKGTKRAGSKT